MITISGKYLNSKAMQMLMAGDKDSPKLLKELRRAKHEIRQRGIRLLNYNSELSRATRRKLRGQPNANI